MRVQRLAEAAVEALARSWADETKNMTLRVNSVNPGATRTAMRAQAMPGEDPQTLPHPSEVGKTIAALADPARTETGMIYDVPKKRFEVYQMPA